MSLEERAKLPNISPQRAEVIVAGGQILEGVMRAFNIEKLQPCGYALREGVIIDYLREIESESLPPVPDVEDKKLRDVFAVGRRFGYEESHALQVADLAEKIFDALAPIYKLCTTRSNVAVRRRAAARCRLSHLARIASQTFVLSD